MQKPSRFTMLILPVLLAFMLALTGCSGMIQRFAPTPTPTAMPTAEPMLKVDGIPITFGQSSQNSYVNEYFDIAIDLDDLWFAEDTRQLDQINGFAVQLSDEKRQQAYLDLLNSGNSVTEFYAHTNTGLEAIHVQCYDYSQQENQYPDITMHFIENSFKLRDLLVSNGYNMLDGLSLTADIAGSMQFCFYFSYERYGVVWDCAMVMMKRDNYVMTILFSSMVTKHAKEMITLVHKPVQ